MIAHVLLICAVSDRNAAKGASAGAEVGDGVGSKKKKGGKARSAKMIPLELQRLFARLQLLDTRTVSTEVSFALFHS